MEDFCFFIIINFTWKKWKCSFLLLLKESCGIKVFVLEEKKGVYLCVAWWEIILSWNTRHRSFCKAACISLRKGRITVSFQAKVRCPRNTDQLPSNIYEAASPFFSSQQRQVTTASSGWRCIKQLRHWLAEHICSWSQPCRRGWGHRGNAVSFPSNSPDLN